MEEEIVEGIYLNDFPDYTFVYLEEEYRKCLLNAGYGLFGSLTNLAKAIGISAGRLSYWFRGEQKDYKRNKVGLQFIPLSRLKKISRYLVDAGNKEFSIMQIQKNVLMYRMQAGNPIRNPIFPITESDGFVRLLFHLIADGYSGRKGDNAGYRNTCNELLQEFRNDLSIFGEVPIYEQEYSIKFPRILAHIVEDFYGINSRGYESHISDKVFALSNKKLCFGVKAFADDEGTVYSHSIRLTSANCNLLEGVKKILDILEIRTNQIKYQKNCRARYGKVYYLDIRDIVKYSEIIGFTHPKKKFLLNKFVKNIKLRQLKKLIKS